MRRALTGLLVTIMSATLVSGCLVRTGKANTKPGKRCPDGYHMEDGACRPYKNPNRR
jgi:hypothetical protein